MILTDVRALVGHDNKIIIYDESSTSYIAGALLFSTRNILQELKMQKMLLARILFSHTYENFNEITLKQTGKML